MSTDIPKREWPPVTIRIHPNEYPKLQELAKKEDRTIAAQCERFVKQNMAKLEGAAA